MRLCLLLFVKKVELLSTIVTVVHLIARVQENYWPQLSVAHMLNFTPVWDQHCQSEAWIQEASVSDKTASVVYKNDWNATVSLKNGVL